MSQLHLSTLQREMIDVFWQADGARTDRETQAETQRRTATGTIEQKANAKRERASTLLQSVHSAREAARAELQKVSLSLLVGGVPLATGGLRTGKPNAEFERTGGVVQEVATQLSALVAVLLKHREDTEVATRGLLSTELAIATTVGGMVGLVLILAYISNLGVLRGYLNFIVVFMSFGYLIVWLGLITWLSKEADRWRR